MKTFGSMSIRAQLVVIIVLMATAMGGLITISSIRLRNHDLSEAQNFTARIAGRTTSEIVKLADNTELMLNIIAKLPSVHQRNASAVNRLLADIVKRYPQYSNLRVVDRSGLLWSSAVPIKGPVSYGDRRYFINGMTTGRFSSGEYPEGGFPARPAITYGLPVVNTSGRITGMIIADIVLDSYRELLKELRFPETSTILLVDHQGIVLYNSLRPNLEGTQDRTDLFRQMANGPTEGAVHALGEHDSGNITYYRKLWLPAERKPYLYVRVTMPSDSVLNKAYSEMTVNILLMSSLMLLAIGIASYISKRYILDKIAVLRSAAKRISQGNLEVKIADQVSGGELGSLGQAFDDMAHSLTNDITNRTVIENALRESNSRFMTMIEQAPFGIALIDSLTGQIYVVNARFAEITGRSKEEMAHIDSIGVTHPDDVPEELDNMALLREGTVSGFHMNKRYVRPDGSLAWTHMTVAVIQGEDHAHPHHLCMVEDITERRKMDQELLKAQKLESIGVLAGGIAHDFNNLLSGVFGYIEMAKLEADFRNQRDITQYLSRALGVFDKAKELTRQLLTFSKGGAPILKTQSIAELLHRTVSFALSGSDIHPRFFIPEDLWMTEFDETQIVQVLDNIVINSREALPLGGNLDVIAKNISALEATEISPRKPYVVISIRDYGTGIREEHLPHIFDPFFTTKLHGTGLGLSTCYSIIKQHGGRIEVESEAGKGTTFLIYLPAAATAAPDIKTSKTLELPFQSGRNRILLMDDEPFILDVASTILAKMGYDVVTTMHGDEAITKTREAVDSGRRFCAAILDLTIAGGRGGKETVPELLNIDPHMKVVVSSGYSDDPVISRPTDYGFTGTLIKPYRHDDMAKLLVSLFGESI